MLHLGGLVFLGFGLRPAQGVVVAVEPEAPNPLRFELIETSEGAEVEEPRTDDSRFVSDRNTRSQEQQPDLDLPVTRSPRITSEEGEGHDLRQVGTAPRLGAPSPATAPPSRPSPPSPPSPTSPAQPRERAEPSREPTEESAGIQVRPQPVPKAPSPDPLREKTAPQATPTPPRPQTPPTPAAPPAEQVTPPTAFQIGETFRPGKPSLSPLEQDLVARAEAEGEFSFEATQHFFGDYWLRLTRKIENTWVLLLTSRYKRMGPSRAVLDFLVMPDGGVRALTPLSAEGDELFPLVCGLAVRNSGPFDPVPYDAVPQLPEGARDLPLRIRATFSYQ